MTLNYLEFDYSEDAEGIGTFETLASVSPSQVAAVHAEVAEVLAWAFRTFPDGHGPVAEGFEWDHDLQGQREFTAAESLCFDERTGRIEDRADAHDAKRLRRVRARIASRTAQPAIT